MNALPESSHPESIFEDTLALFLASRSAGAEPRWSHDLTDFWLRVTHIAAACPEQGWKLHVSANLQSAAKILERALETLYEFPVCFKFTRAPNQLLSLNRGDGTATQIGKFITVYPQSDSQAVEIAQALDRATAGLSGPAIASDRKLSPRSLVHYRYGSFGGQFLQTSIGALMPAIRTPDGTLVPDKRGTSFQHPSWVRDPFFEAGVVVEGPPASGLIYKRFFPIAKIYSSPFSTVSLAVDVQEGRRCVLKAVRHDLSMGDTELAASELLRREAATLASLAPDPIIPTVYGLFDDGEQLYLAMEDIEGMTLEQAIAMRRDTYQPITNQQILGWSSQLARLLGRLHERGYGYLDLKPTNLIVCPQGSLRLIDFDSAAPLGQLHSIIRGTRGYLSPQRLAGLKLPISVSDDIYALGALMYLMATGSEPSLVADPLHLLKRPLQVMAPTLHPQLIAVIERCLREDPAQRFADMEEVAAALHSIEPRLEVRHAPLGAEAIAPAPADKYKTLALGLAETLVKSATPVAKGEGLAWSSSHPTGAGLQSRDVNSGSAGALLALSALAADSPEPQFLHAIERGARWLSQAPRHEGEPLPGLYVGESGIITALLRAGQVLRQPGWIELALQRSKQLESLPYGSPDLFNGTAGRLRGHLWLWDETGAPEQLVAAQRCGEALLSAASVNGLGEWSWVIPPGYDGMSGDRYLGYAHGAAGIADALLDLFVATGDERYVAAVRGTAAWLVRHGQTPAGLDDASVWPSREGEPPATSFWCHGATGIGQFLLRAGASGLFPDGLMWAERAARAVARLTRWVGTTRCHGLSGNIEFLLNCYQATGQEAFRSEAETLGTLLLAWETERGGLLLFPSESPTIFSPDYMVGYAGVAACLLRMAHPEQRLLFRRDTTGFVPIHNTPVPLPALP